MFDFFLHSVCFPVMMSREVSQALSVIEEKGMVIIMVFKTKGTCSREIEIEIDGDVIRSVRFVGGCAGNTAGVAKLVQGMKVDDVIEKLEGTTCGVKPTSCPDQLAKALRQIKEQPVC